MKIVSTPAVAFLAIVFHVAGMPVDLAGLQTTVPAPTRQSDVVYGRKSGLALTMEVIAPAKANGRGVIWVVSSSGISSRDQTLTPSFERRISPFLERGYTVFAVIHGSAPVFHVRDAAQDAMRSVRFVRHHADRFGVDGLRLGIVGSSSGGLLALMAALGDHDAGKDSVDLVDRESSHVQAAGCFFAPTDLVNFGKVGVSILDALRDRSGVIDPSFVFYDFDRPTGARVAITEATRLQLILSDISPANLVTADDPPTILIHGEQDRAVPVQQSRTLLERLRAAKVESRLVVREGKEHAWPGWESDSALIAEWFDTFLSQRR